MINYNYNILNYLLLLVSSEDLPQFLAQEAPEPTKYAQTLSHKKTLAMQNNCCAYVCSHQWLARTPTDGTNTQHSRNYYPTHFSSRWSCIWQQKQEWLVTIFYTSTYKCMQTNTCNLTTILFFIFVWTCKSSTVTSY